MKSIYQDSHSKLKLSVSIITKNRPKDVISCLNSLKKQTVSPNEFIIVDSSTDRQTKDVISNFAKSVRYPVVYIHEPRTGFPIARNHVLQVARNQWVAFTDDDCITDPHWVTNFIHAITSHPQAAAIAGESKSYSSNDMISHATTFNEWHWKTKVRDGDMILDLETLDNKNIAYNLDFFKKHHISYDERRAKAYFGASDDCDLGMQIQKCGGKAYYDKSVVVYHKDLTDLRSYTQRLIIRSFAHATYENKWHSYRKTMKLTKIKHIRFGQFFLYYVRSNKFNFSKSMILFTLLMYTSLLTKCMKLYIKLKTKLAE